ncbi:hypothetical protein ALC57_15737, partial [Trachymyrmex cornetzi]
CLRNIAASSRLLTALGFVINENKSSLIPSKSYRFLGFRFDTKNFAVSIPSEKREKLLHKTLSILGKKSCKICLFASFIGSLISVCPAVKYGLLHTKILEREKFLALLSSNDFEAEMLLLLSIREDLLWWKAVFSNPHQCNFISSSRFELEIFTDASLTGWGAICTGVHTHGFWPPRDRQFHINYLELLAVFHGLRCFVSHLRGCNILLRVDNSTALLYVNRMGSVQFPLLSSLAREIWCWCADSDLFLYAAYIPSAQNLADAHSRIISDETEWSLSQIHFNKIEENFGPFDIDLFASSINTKCVRFVSWVPDPEALAVDAFSLDWSKFYFYAFPPFILILRVLHKIILDRAEGIMVVPRWLAQPWFPLFNQLTINQPIFFEANINMLSSPFRDYHPAWSSLSLVVAKLSARPS